MSVINGWKIVQIIAAQPGWKAVHCRELENRQVEISNSTLVCWAVVEAIGESGALRTEVRGVEQRSNHLVIVEDLITADQIGEESVDRNQYFLGYNDPEAHKESDYWITQAKVRLKAENDKRAKHKK